MRARRRKPACVCLSAWGGSSLVMVCLPSAWEFPKGTAQVAPMSATRARRLWPRKWSRRHWAIQKKCFVCSPACAPSSVVALARQLPPTRPAPPGILHPPQCSVGRKERVRHRPMSPRLVLEIHQLSGELRGNGCVSHFAVHLMG